VLATWDRAFLARRPRSQVIFLCPSTSERGYNYCIVICENLLMDYSNTKTPTRIIDSFIVEAMPPVRHGTDFAEAMPPAPRGADTDRILAAVRARQPKLVPVDLNRYALGEDLDQDISRYKILVQNSGTPWKDKVSKLRQLERILSAVDAERWPTWPLGLSRLQDWCNSTLANIERGSHPELRVRKPIDWLVGYILPKTFEKHFKRRASATPTGPYARFAVAVLKEFHIKKSNGDDYEAGTVVKMFDEVDKGIIRHKGQRVPQAVILQNIPPKPRIPDDDLPPF
jgi:hypothetical protein